MKAEEKNKQKTLLDRPSITRPCSENIPHTCLIDVSRQLSDFCEILYSSTIHTELSTLPLAALLYNAQGNPKIIHKFFKYPED